MCVYVQNHNLALLLSIHLAAKNNYKAWYLLGPHAFYTTRYPNSRSQDGSAIWIQFYFLLIILASGCDRLKEFIAKTDTAWWLGLYHPWREHITVCDLLEDSRDPHSVLGRTPE